MLKWWLIIFCVVLWGSTYASQMRSGCYLMNQPGQSIQGVNLDQSFEIASVTKLFTSFFALKMLGPDYRFRTYVYLKKVDEHLFDVHFEGGRDPYLGREMMQFLTAELNKIGVTEIRNLTFDENFKFIIDVRLNQTAHSFFSPSDPSSERVARNLRIYFDHPTRFYKQLKEAVLRDLKMKLPETLVISASSISFISRDQFKASEYERPLEYKSTSLVRILKEMNRNSNNHSANQIFEFLGGAQAFHNFYFDLFPHHKNVVHFYNGSGDRVYLDEGYKIYNRGSCRSIIELLVALENELKIFGLSLIDIMPVAGQDIPGQLSTITPSYNTEMTRNALIGKTGTINPSVALAGKIFTQSGEVYFNYIYGTTESDWGTARSRIRGQVVRLIKKFGGQTPVNYRPQRFFPFDQESILR